MSGFFYWRYRLRLASGERLNARTGGGEIEGALLRDSLGGHACLQPWPSLGQGDLDASLRLLRERGGGSALIRSCLRCLRLDRTARAAGRSVFERRIVPRSHLSVSDGASLAWLEQKNSEGFSLFKLKGSPEIRETAHRVQRLIRHFGSRLRLRIDFNESLDREGLLAFVAMLGNEVGAIDFIEDPLPYDARAWAELEGALPFDLAVDRESPRASRGFAVRVVKPAWEGRPPAGDARLVFTSAMDHPIGQVFAAAEAARAGCGTDEGGLLTHWLFEPNEFSEALAVEDRRLVAPQGTGLGFDDLLEGLPWRSL